MIARPSEKLKSLVNRVAAEMDADPGYGQRWHPKIQDAMDYVLTGAVNLDTSTVYSGAHHYEIDPQHGCTCPDARIKDRYCKHWVALEMARRVQALENQGEDPMPKTTPQDQWEADTQNGAGEPSLFTQEPEPDDIPDPEVPMPTPIPPWARQDGVHRVEGHQYVDYPSTLCIKRHIGMTEIMWTFRGALDEEVWGRASRMIRTLDEAAKRYAPPVSTPPSTPPPAPTAPPPTPTAAAAGGEKAVNHGVEQGAPWCTTHNCYYERWTKGQRTWHAHKTPEGGFCNPPRG